MKNTPSRYRTVIRSLLLTKRRVIRLNNILQCRNTLLLPYLPPIPAQNTVLIPRRILLILRIPLGRRNRRLHTLQIIKRPILRPTRLATRHNRRQLHNLPLIRLVIPSLRPNQLTRQILLMPTRHNTNYRTTRL